MSVNNIGTPTANLDQLVRRTLAQADANNDGRLSKSELGSFVTKLLEGLSADDGKATPVDGGSNGSPVTPRAVATPLYTFAGFDPTAHLGESRADVTHPKYGVYDYLTQNGIDPNSKTWAPAAAEALNKQYNTTIFKAIDGETLAYGDEYVHSAPNGYGLRRGEYDPGAVGEFFWGFTG